MGTTNSLRGHSSINNRGIFYLTIQNFLPQRTFISRVILVIKKNMDSDPLLIVSCKLSEYSKLLEDHYQDLTHSLDMQQQMTSGNTHTQGVTSALKDSILFHTAENMMVDLLHTFPEGIITYE